MEPLSLTLLPLPLVYLWFANLWTLVKTLFHIECSLGLAPSSLRGIKCWIGNNKGFLCFHFKPKSRIIHAFSFFCFSVCVCDFGPSSSTFVQPYKALIIKGFFYFMNNKDSINYEEYKTNWNHLRFVGSSNEVVMILYHFKSGQMLCIQPCKYDFLF